jgi:hypothetical protein
MRQVPEAVVQSHCGGAAQLRVDIGGDPSVLLHNFRVHLSSLTAHFLRFAGAFWEGARSVFLFLDKSWDMIPFLCIYGALLAKKHTHTSMV